MTAKTPFVVASEAKQSRFLGLLQESQAYEFMAQSLSVCVIRTYPQRSLRLCGGTGFQSIAASAKDSIFYESGDEYDGAGRQHPFIHAPHVSLEIFFCQYKAEMDRRQKHADKACCEGKGHI